ncbi:GerW family sporulation protein [Paenibacillus crassostreae]|uniref:GerW family sporulation protein n=1 Tax=Paenibacillus crassostreae TaxID=1763538 RepID=UPI000838C51F|nr:GerW family sporulation protein [Paenibacillus crassostreae]AOZ91410.1 sporulation protein YtfJ [Paenibacillus crassostreae]
MEDHPIKGLMQTAMENLKSMVDVNTIVGDPVQTPDGSVILPISKVAFGFAAGGSDFNVDRKAKSSGSSSNEHQDSKRLPFGGGTGGGVSIRPIAFLVVGKDGVYILPLDSQTHIYEKLIDTVPYVMEKIQTICEKSGNKSNSNNKNANNSNTGTPGSAPIGNMSELTNL